MLILIELDPSLIFRPTNLNAMRKVYKGIPEVIVEPLHFAPKDISGERLLAMMKVDDSTHKPNSSWINYLLKDYFRNAFVYGGDYEYTAPNVGPFRL